VFSFSQSQGASSHFSMSQHIPLKKIKDLNCKTQTQTQLSKHLRFHSQLEKIIKCLRKQNSQLDSGS